MGVKTTTAIVLCFLMCGCAPHKRAPVYDLKMQGRSSGATIVAPGESAATLAKRYALTIEDIIAMNGGKIYPGQHVQLPPPRTYRARTGDTVKSVASMFDVQANDIIADNHLTAPYALSEGQVIHLTAAPTTVTLAPTATEGEPIPHGNGMFLVPVQGRVISEYGAKPGGQFNDGINIAAKPGDNVRAADAGTVVYAGNKLSGYGNLILIRHDNGYFTVYSHMAENRVAKGARVARGQTIGIVGASGQVRTPQLHFEIRKGTQSLNPDAYL